MKRTIKIAAIALVFLYVLAFPVTEESYLQMHYDTLERRNLKRVSYFGIKIKEVVKWRSEEYNEEHREIYEVNPSSDRWYTPEPHLTESLRSVRWRSPRKYPDALLLRNDITRRIFERYNLDHSVPLALDSFRELEELMPGSEQLERIEYQDTDSLLTKIKSNKALQDLFAVAPK